jgi:glutaredoxin
MGKIVIYTLPTCQHCQLLKDTLNQLQIPYQYIDVNAHPAIGNNIESKLETRSYPIIEFPSENIFNQSVYLSPSGENDLATSPHHRTFDNINEAVEIIKSYLQ